MAANKKNAMSLAQIVLASALAVPAACGAIRGINAYRADPENAPERAKTAVAETAGQAWDVTSQAARATYNSTPVTYVRDAVQESHDTGRYGGYWTWNGLAGLGMIGAGLGLARRMTRPREQRNKGAH